jgi:predicted AAA+ superfamily ATPase
MIQRSALLDQVRTALKRSRVVALLGPRQSGKTTLARQLANEQGGTLFDLENPTDLARLAAPQLALEGLSGLVVLDEIQLRPDLLPLLRVLADRVPLPAKFLILGSASPDLIRGSSESLAGRVEFVDVGGFDLGETGAGNPQSLWLRGGFPLSWLASNDTDSLAWRQGFIRTFLERDIGAFGIGTPPEALRRLWQMLAHYHGGVWNASEFGRALGIASPSAKRHLDILTGTFMARLLPPWFENLGKRLVRQPKVYIRDSGILHALLGLATLDEVRGHPKCGASWEGFCIEQILSVTGGRDAYFWATHAGAELDLMVVRGSMRIGFEFKYGDAPRPSKSMHVALEDLRLDELHVVYPGNTSYPLADRLFASSLPDAIATAGRFA